MKNDADIKTCSVWLCLTNADETRIKFWSQILKCSVHYLRNTIKCVEYLVSDKRGIKNDDAFLIVIYNEMKDMTPESMQKVFNDIRYGGVEDEQTN